MCGTKHYSVGLVSACELKIANGMRAVRPNGYRNDEEFQLTLPFVLIETT